MRSNQRNMYDTILLPTEENPGVEQAVELAIDLADRYDAELHVLYVAEDADHRLADIPVGNRRAELSSEGEEAISLVEDAARDAGVSVQTRVGVGEPHHSILEHMQRVSADFVVMGTHGRTGVNRLLAGSVAEKVLRQADVPVLAVPLSDEA